ncbi:MAG: alpha-ketoacid dehydrogenase subunit beta [Trueperaceae bacterium]
MKVSTAETARAPITMVQAINEAMALALERDPRVLLFGQDVGVMGGVFRASDALQQRFGEERVFDTPLAEAGIVGLGIGLALGGMRPIAEVQFAGFLYPALDQILSHLGRYRHRTRGRFSLPMVVRAPYGGGVHTPEQHADSPEAVLAHAPGLKVVIPSSPERAKGLLLAAIDDPDPVFFLEAIKLYRSERQAVPAGHYTFELGKARIVRPGNAVSLFCYGGMVEVCMKAAEVAAREGVELEVVDLETLAPLDEATILDSVRRTGRAVIVYEAPRSGGFGAEVAARIAEEAIYHLEAPIVRVTGWDAPYPPFTSVEHHYRPDAKRVLAAVRKVLV